jgi:hypothetical protein
MGGLFYLGTLGLKSARSVKRFLGIISILTSLSVLIFIVSYAYGLSHHEDRIRNDFTGKYKAIIDDNNTEDIEMTISTSTYSISENSYTDCNTGTWSPALTDDGYIVEFNCPEGRPLGQFRLRDNKLSNYSQLRFLRIKSTE